MNSAFNPIRKKIKSLDVNRVMRLEKVLKKKK